MRWAKSRGIKENEANENGLCFSVAEAVSIPLIVVLNIQVAVIRRMLYASLWMDVFIAKLRGSKD